MRARGILPPGMDANARPPLNRDELTALHCWACMGRRLRLEALPAYLALYPVEDIDLLIELLLTLESL